MSRPAHRRGFSLIELMVVLGIVLILIGLLMPALSRSRAQAQSVQCRNQLRQVGLALLDYAQNNAGEVAPRENWSMQEKLWPEIVLGEVRPAIVLCPTAVEGEWLSYQLSAWLWAARSGGVRYGTHHMIPTDEIVVAGENEPGSNNDFSPFGYGGDFVTYDPDRHGPHLGSNYLFMDFHVSNELPILKEGYPDRWFVPLPGEQIRPTP
jgi:prepilin-type N-terminal cleavage/methylation domain-containing protein/prepilin-type processing-associated H-X9-DG protein